MNLPDDRECLLRMAEPTPSAMRVEAFVSDTPSALPRTVVVTGASGFVGRRVCRELSRRGQGVRAVVRSSARGGDLPGEILALGDLCTTSSWSPAIDGVDCVIHAAARVHIMHDTAADSLDAFRAINVHITESLARAAAARGVRRFVYVSSIKVNGDATSYDAPFTAAEPPQPQDPYGMSKWEAELALRRISEETGLEVVVVRPPLVYGPGVRGNFLRLMRLVQAGAVFPLKSVDNARSLIYVDNLVSALLACTSAPAAAGKTYLVRDAEDMSTPELITRLAGALGKKPRLFPTPVSLLKLAGAVTGKNMEVDRLTGSLRVDSSHIRDTIGWTPPYSVDEGLAETVRWFESPEAALVGTQPASA
jgi:nucleoside-diphosphate-sugar epimerase